MLEKIELLFKEFEKINQQNFESILNTGKNLNGSNFESLSIGKLDSKDMQSLATLFKNGIRLLPEILKNIPELLKKLDEDLEKEAIENIDKKLKGDKEKIKENEKSEPEVGGIRPDGEIENQNNSTSTSEISQEVDPK
ncbi:MAG: hypothetical protein NTU81_01105 [Candidatus Nomurabacteria bacterium]|nr:hypothetical protein [Candidatus Nomurabacteria bacterium]